MTAALRIGADGSWMRWPSGGLTRYLDELLHSIAGALGDGERLVVYYNSRRGAPMFEGRVTERFVRLPNRTAWNQVRVPLAVRADRCDVYLGGAFVVPRALRIPSVAVLHDCLAFRDPSAKPGAEGRYWRRWTRDAARRAARIVTVSRFVAADCERFVDADPSRIRVVYPGVGARFTPSDEPAGSIAARLSLPWPFVLHVGSFDAHKGAGAAIEAVKTVAARRGALKLARVGPAGNVDVADESVVNLGRVADATLVDLYRAASAVLVTSTHEGFGLPVLEAMACGTPVIATRAGGLPEAGGDAALYAAADAASIADALERVLAAPGEEAGRRREAGLRHVAAFSWDRAAGGVLDVLREAASR